MIMRLDKNQKVFRLFRVTWDKGTVGDVKGYSNKISFSLTPKIAVFNKKYNGWELCFLFIRINRLMNWGGLFT